MVYFEQFRLPILFFISGVGSVILLSKVTAQKFTLNKVTKLLIPLFIGSLLIVPSQTYIENIDQLQSFIITSFICFFIVKPFNVLRFMFGLKPNKTEESVAYIKSFKQNK
jgi:hypothetical protein